MSQRGKSALALGMALVGHWVSPGALVCIGDSCLALM